MFVQVKPEDFQHSPFQLIGNDWMLVTAEKDGKANAMTASWGGLGVMWGRNVAYIVIRPQRYTKEFVDGAETLSLSFFDAEFKTQLSYLGTTSGRDEDKITKAGLTLTHEQGTPYFEQAKLVLRCKKLYAQAFDPKCFIDLEINPKWYPTADHHMLYIAEITDILAKK